MNEAVNMEGPWGMKKDGTRINRLVCLLLCACAVLLPFAWAAGELNPENVSPTTGMPTDRPYQPVLVQMANTWQDGMPCRSLSEADIVYEVPFMPQRTTCYLALFGDHHPDEVGPVQGTRLFALEMQQAWRCPLVFAGTRPAADKAVSEFFRMHLTTMDMRVDVLGTRGSFYAYQDEALGPLSDRFFYLAKWVEEKWPGVQAGNAADSASSALLFSQEAPEAEGPDVHSIRVKYATYDRMVSYAYQVETGRYERSIGGKPQVDGVTGKRIGCENIIVQVNDLYESDFYATVPTRGMGRIIAYIGGKAIRGTWERFAMEDPVRYYDDAGNELYLRPGQTFIQVVPEIMVPGEKAWSDGRTEHVYLYAK